MRKITDLLHSIRPESDFSKSKDFLEDGLLDSFDMITLVAGLDKAFNISIDGMDIIPENFRNTQTIKALLENYKVQP